MRIILKNQKILVYNDANDFEYRNNCIEILKKDKVGSRWIQSIIPFDSIERIDWVSPCNEYKNQFFNDFNKEKIIEKKIIRYKTKKGRR